MSSNLKNLSSSELTDPHLIDREKGDYCTRRLDGVSVFVDLIVFVLTFPWDQTGFVLFM